MVKNISGFITRAIQGGKMRAPLVVLLSIAIITSGVFIYHSITAVGAIVPASGGTNISLDTTSAPGGSGAYTSLGGISIPEAAPGEIKLGVYTFNLPAGWEFDTLSPVTVSSNGTYMRWWPINPAPNAASFSFEIERASVSTAETILLSGLRVRPTNTTPLSAANIYMTCVNTTGTCGITGVTAGGGGTNFGILNSVAGVAVRLSVTGTATQTAGVGNELTITAYDQFGNVATGYTGSKSLTFSGLNNAPDGNVPKVETVNFGSTTAVTFASGVSNANATTLVAYKAEAGSVDVTDGTINSAGDAAYDLDLTVNPAAAARLEMTAASGTMDAGSSNELTIIAKDAYGNVDTNYAGAKNLTFSGIGSAPAGNAPTVEGSVITAPISVNFTNGQRDADVATLIAYKAEGPVELEVSDGSINSTASSTFDVDLTVRHAAADHLKFSASVSSPQTAGVQFALLALNAVDVYGNLANGANGAAAYSQTDTVAYDLSGLDNGPTSGTDAYTTSVTFVSGVSTTALNTTLYRAQSTTITANSGSLAGTDEASNSFTVNAAAASAVNITTQPGNTNGTVDNPLQQQPVISVTDAYGNANSSGQTVTVILGTGNGPLLNNSTTTLNGIGTFISLGYNKSGEAFDMAFQVGSITSATSTSVTALSPGAVTTVTVSGDTPITSGIQSSSYTAVSKDQYNNTVSDTYTWTKTDGTGTATLSVDKLTGVLVGGVTIKATGLNAVFGTKAVTVNVGAASQVRVETAADGSGIVVLAQTLAPLQATTTYAITRDVNNNFVANVAADAWVLVNKTGSIVDGDLVSAVDSKSAVFTPSGGGTAEIEATEGALTKVKSGVITVEALTEIYVATTGNDSNPGTSGLPKLTIQNAITSVAANGTTTVAAGTYAETVTINKKVVLQGAGATTIIQPAVNNNGIILQSSADQSTIKNLKIITSNNSGAANIAINLSDANDVTIDSVTIETSGDTAMGIWLCGTVDGCAAGITGLTVVKSSATIASSSTAFYTSYSTSPHSVTLGGGSAANANTFSAVNGNPIELYDGAGEISYNTITGNAATGGNAITVKTNLSDVTGAIKIKNNTINGGGGSGMVFIGATTGYVINSTSNEVSGNTFSNWAATTGAGLRLTNSLGGTTSGFKVFGNTFTSPDAGVTPSAKDDTAAANTWYSGTTGNDWSAFAANANYPTTYLISGTAGSIDSYPVGKLDATASTVTVNSPVTADNIEIATVTITAKGNNGGNLLAGISAAKIYFTVSGTNNSTSSPSATNNSGVSTSTITSTKAETKTITVIIDGVQLTSQPQVVFNPGALDHIAFTAEPATGGIAGADFAVQPIVKLYDQFNNILTTDGASQVTLSAVLSVDGVTAGAGTLNATANPVTVVAGVATFAGVDYTGVDSIKLKAVTGAKTVLTGAIQNNPANLESFSLINFGTLTAGTATTTVITAKDAYGNATTKDTDGSTFTASESITFTSTATVAPNTTSKPTYNGNDLTDGETVSVDLSSGSFTSANIIFYKAGETPTLTVTLNGKSGVAASVGVNSAAISALSIAGDSPRTTAQTSTITVTGTDQYQNQVTDNGVVVTLSAGGGANLASGGGTLTAGVFSTTLSKDTPGSSTVTASSGALTPGNVVITFTDGTAPNVDSWTPTDGSTAVSRSINPTLTFSEDMATTTLISANIKLYKYSDNSSVGSNINVSGNRQAIIIPSSILDYNTQYYITISTSVTDSNGVAFGAAWDSSNKNSHEFTTEVAETIAPTVVSWAPADDTTNASTSPQIWVKFSEAITYSAGSIELRKYSDNSEVSVTRTLSESNTKITLTPNAPLSYGTQYYFFIGTGVEDVVGNPFAANTWYAAQKAQHEFTTIQGMTVQVYAEKTDGSADNTYTNGWRYRYEMTLNTTETKLQVQFPTGWQKSGGGGSIATDGNMRMLVDESTGGQITGLWDDTLITNGSGNVKSYALNTTYAGQNPLQSAIDALDSNGTLTGRQIIFYVFTKIPGGTAGGIYTADYGIQTSN